MPLYRVDVADRRVDQVFIAALTASAVIGSERTRAPTALKMALAIAGAMTVTAGSPQPTAGSPIADDADVKFRHLAHAHRRIGIEALIRRDNVVRRTTQYLIAAQTPVSEQSVSNRDNAMACRCRTHQRCAASR
jgi:hypothetical protein